MTYDNASLHAETDTAPATPDVPELALRDTHWSSLGRGVDHDPNEQSAEDSNPAQPAVPAEGGRSWMGGRTHAYGPRFNGLQFVPRRGDSGGVGETVACPAAK